MTTGIESHLIFQLLQVHEDYCKRLDSCRRPRSVFLSLFLPQAVVEAAAVAFRQTMPGKETFDDAHNSHVTTWPSPLQTGKLSLTRRWPSGVEVSEMLTIFQISPALTMVARSSVFATTMDGWLSIGASATPIYFKTRIGLRSVSLSLFDASPITCICCQIHYLFLPFSTAKDLAKLGVTVKRNSGLVLRRFIE